MQNFTVSFYFVSNLKHLTTLIALRGWSAEKNVDEINGDQFVCRDSDSEKRRSWVSSSNLAYDNNSVKSESNYSNPSSWTSTPDLAKLEDDTQAVTTVSIRLPKRKQKPIDTGQRAGREVTNSGWRGVR